jgi:hypothetical protein
MFALVHFSRVFPYIHPYLFPIEPKQTVQSAADDTEQGLREAGVAGFDSATREAAICTSSSQGRRLKNLHRRHSCSQRNVALTYSGVSRNEW